MRSPFFFVACCLLATACADSNPELTPQQRALAEEGLGGATVVHQTVTVTNALIGLSALDPNDPIATTTRGIAARLNDTLRGQCGEITLTEPSIVEVNLGAGCPFADDLTIAGSMKATTSTNGVEVTLRKIEVKGLPLDGTINVVPGLSNLPTVPDAPRGLDFTGKIVSGSTTILMEPPLFVSAQSRRVVTFREARVMTPSRSFGIELIGPSSVRGECFPSWGVLRVHGDDDTDAFVHLKQESGISGNAWPVAQANGAPADEHMSFPAYGSCTPR